MPSMRRLRSHLSPVSSPQFYKYLSLFSTKLVLAVPSQVARGWLPFSKGIVHILKKFAPRLGKKGSRPGGSPNSLWNNEHSGKALYFLSCSFIFFHFHSLFFHCFFISFIFFRFLSFSFSFVSFSFIFVHCVFILFSFFFFLFFFSRALKILFLPRFPHDFLLKLPCKKSIFWAISGVPHWALFFFSRLFFHFFIFFIFVFFFNFFPCFSFFSFVVLFFLFYFFIFLLFFS